MTWNLQKEKNSDDGYLTVYQRLDIDRAETSHDLSTGALSYTTTLGVKFRVLQVLIHSTQVLNDTTVTVKFNSVTGANYDTAIGQEDFDGAQDIGLLAGDNLLGVFGEAGDEISITSTGSDAAGVLYITVMYEKIK
jgi:hypothetical protein